MKISRRSFLKTAAAIGASLAWVGPARGSRVSWHERRDLYPQGVASGDPDPHSVILWTRRPFAQGTRELLVVEVAEDELSAEWLRMRRHRSRALRTGPRACWLADSSRRALTGIGLPTPTVTAAESGARSQRRCQTIPVR